MDPKLLVLVDEYLKADAAVLEATLNDETPSPTALARLQKDKEKKALRLADYISKNLQALIRSQSPDN